MRSPSPSSPVAESNTIARAARSSNQRPTFEPAVSSRRADALIGAIILGQESQIDWKAALAFQKEIKHRMHLDYLRTGWGRPHIDLIHLLRSIKCIHFF
jgi:hypothetical protein